MLPTPLRFVPWGEHSRLPPFAECAKDGTLCADGADEIKSLPPGLAELASKNQA